MTELTQFTMFKQKDIEKLFAACVYSSPLDAVQSCGWLRPELLIDIRIKRFWASVLDRVRPEMSGTEAVSNEILAIAIEQDMALDLVGWASTTFLYSPIPYANEIARRNYLTVVSSRIGDLVQAIQQSNDNAVRDVIRNMGDLDVSKNINIPTAFDIAEQFDRIVTNGLRSVDTYIPPLDNAIGGLERQTLTVLAGRPSTGKTALAFQIARTAAYNGKTVLFFSLEMSNANLWARAACPVINTTWRDVRAGKISKEQTEKLLEESYKLAANFTDKLRVIDIPQTTDSIWQAVAQLRPDLVIVDHLRLVKDANTSEVKRLGAISQRLKEVAKNFECAVLLLAQLNRDSEKRIESRPILADLRDSGEIEENADLVLMLHAEKFEGGTKPEKSPVECWIRKFRDGPRDVLIKLWFAPKAEWFEGSSV